MTDLELADIEKNITSSKEVIDFGKAVERLKTNRDFKKVILEGYLEKEAIRLVHLKADPSVQTPVQQTSIIAAIDAIGNLASFLSDAIRSGEISTKQLADSEQMREEMINEERGE